MTTRILVLGDFSGRASRGVSDPDALRARRRLFVDRDELEERLQELDVEVRLASGETLSVRELDELEPDAFVRVLPSFEGLRSLRARLQDPATFAAAAAEIGAGAQEVPDDVPTGIPLPDDLLAAALEATESEGTRLERLEDMTGDQLAARLAREIVAPFVVPAPDPQLPALLESVDRALGEHARAVLHDPAFLAVEDAWRGLDRLTRALETGPGLEVRMLDVSVEELHEALRGAGLPVLGGGGEAPRADLVVLLHRFDATSADARLLSALAGRVREEGAVLVADAHPRLAGCATDRLEADQDAWDFEPSSGARDSWTAARAEHGADVALVVNRAALRAPYGPQGASVESFAFDELEDAGRDGVAWGSGAWAVATLFGQLATDAGRTPDDLGAALEIGRQPLVLVREHGETVQVPCAEVELREKALRSLAEKGLCALRSARGSDSITVGPVRALDGDVPRLASS